MTRCPDFGTPSRAPHRLMRIKWLASYEFQNIRDMFRSGSVHHGSVHAAPSRSAERLENLAQLRP